MNNIFTKNDLYSGQLVITRNGRKYIITKTEDGCLVGIGETPYSYYAIECNCNEDLTNIHLDISDIMKVYGRPKKAWECQLLNIWNIEYRDLLWERDTIKEMTLSEVCEALGYEVKIVKGD